jgi:adenine deaminase
MKPAKVMERIARRERASKWRSHAAHAKRLAQKQEKIKQKRTKFMQKIVSGYIVDIEKKEIFAGEIYAEAGKIIEIRRTETCDNQYIIPPFVDAHIHIESSMVTPAHFAEVAVVHGTVATVSDPHEIGNVLGVAGVDFMIENGKQTPFKFFFGAPSCVPATSFETAGAVIDSVAIDQLLGRDDIYYLAEMMNYPGVIYDDAEVWAKIAAAHRHKKPIDGHAPNVRGENLRKYASAGITTDHECMQLDEAREKAALGMKILIREGSAAKNFEALQPIIAEYPEQVMFCSDDKHPDDLELGHINQLLLRALAKGHDMWDLLRICSRNVVRHYNLSVGLLQVGDFADFVVVDNLQTFKVLSTYIDGVKVAENGKALFAVAPQIELPNAFDTNPITEKDIAVAAESNTVKVIEVEDGQLYTAAGSATLQPKDGFLYSDTEQDLLKIVVLNRYQPDAPPKMAFIRGFGLKNGALASTIAHDSHNIVAVGANDADIIRAINALVESKGGISVASADSLHAVPLPIAGLMSAENVATTSQLYQAANQKARKLGTTLNAPFMTLAFMSLLVIPALKLGDKGLFDGETFAFTSIFAEK